MKINCFIAPALAVALLVLFAFGCHDQPGKVHRESMELAERMDSSIQSLENVILEFSAAHETIRARLLEADMTDSTLLSMIRTHQLKLAESQDLLDEHEQILERHRASLAEAGGQVELENNYASLRDDYLGFRTSSAAILKELEKMQADMNAYLNAQ